MRQLINKDVIYAIIQTDNTFVVKCLIALWHRQTDQEQATYSALEDNHIGFNSGDAAFLSEFAEKAARGIELSKDQIGQVRKRLLKYCRQLSTLKEVTKDLV